MSIVFQLNINQPKGSINFGPNGIKLKIMTTKKVSDMTPEEYKLHREKVNAYRAKNRDKINTTQSKWRDERRKDPELKEKDRLSNNKYLRDYYKSHPDKAKEKNRLAYIKRMSTPEGALKEKIRKNLNKNIKKKGFTKKSRTHEYLGCSYEEFKVYIEDQFTDGMTWDNYGEWHIDHIVPISWADNEFEVWGLSYYENLQPMWASENLSKGNRYIG